MLDFLEDITRSKYSFELAGQEGTPVYTNVTDLSKLCFYGGRIVSDVPVTVPLSYEGQVLIDNKPMTADGLDIPVFRPTTSNGKFSVTATGGNITIAINQLQPNSEKERSFVEPDIANSIKVSEIICTLSKENRLAALREIDPSDTSLMGIYVWTLRGEHYETCETALELLLERGYTNIPS